MAQAGAAAPAPIPDAAGAPAPEPPAVVPASPPESSAKLARKRRVLAAGPLPAAAPDPERPVRAERREKITPSALALRLSLGVGAALWIDGGDAELAKPISLQLVAGYALDERLSIVARVASWLLDDPLANEYYGAGVLYRFASDMSVLATLGGSFTRYSDFSRRFQGLGLQADVGQGFEIGDHWDLVLGAHFQVGTPLGGKAADAFTSIETGIFLAIDYL